MQEGWVGLGLFLRTTAPHAWMGWVLSACTPPTWSGDGSLQTRMGFTRSFFGLAASLLMSSCSTAMSFWSSTPTTRATYSLPSESVT